MLKTDYADYLCRTWPVLTTPDDVLEMGQVLRNTWERFFDDREGMQRNLAAIVAWRVPWSWKHFKLMRDSARLFGQRIKEMPRPVKRLSFWDL